MIGQGTLQEILERRRRATARIQEADQQYGRIEGQIRDALGDAPRDWIALESLANEVDYAKPDTQKRFVLWEANAGGGIQIECADKLSTDHAWLARLFLPARTVRFPFNTGDSDPDLSVSWLSIAEGCRKHGGQLWVMPRWSTASRSSVALVPRNIAELPKLDAWPEPEDRRERQVNNTDIKIHMQEWADLQHARAHPEESNRFYRVVPNLGAAVSTAGIALGRGMFRLYSIKTGVHYVGSKYEGPPVANKHRLEANSAMAMLRSAVLRSLPNRDSSFGLQLELLTVTAPLRDGSRDGYQVRDLSCLRSDLFYMPGQAIPYGRGRVDLCSDPALQCTFWRENFAVPLGRAKARLFLNYGLIHTSANAQNFVLGFRNFGRPEVLQFVVRDLGDTSWHDDYIERYLRRFPRGIKVWEAFHQEARAGIRHVLHDTSSGQYPPPHIVRLAAYSVLTHRFGARLRWTAREQYRFVTGIFDGFLGYLREALGIASAYPPQVAQNLIDLGDVEQIGRNAGYPPGIGANPTTYRHQIDQLRLLTSAELLERARWIREHGQANINAEGQLRALVSAEEALLCCAVEKLLLGPTEYSEPYNRIAAHLKRAFAGAWPRVVP